MPRTALSKVSIAALQAELQRRAAQLGKLLALRDDVDKQIADLQVLAGQFAGAVPAPVVKAARKKVKVAKGVATKGKRGSYAQSANEFVISLLAGGKTLTTAELKAAWEKAGRGSRVDNALTALLKSGLVKRAKIKDGLGSNYSLAGKVVAKKPAAAKKTAAKPAAKKGGRRTFTCPTCKKVFASGMLLGGHYKAEPAHRKA